MPVAEVFYATREDLKQALDVSGTARTNAQIDREIQGASRSIEGLVHRYFYPWSGVQTFDWPDHQYAAPWRMWLDRRELLSVTSVVAAGVNITGSIMLRPDDAPMRGEPYSKMEIDLSSTDFFNSGATFQRAIVVTGVFGYTAAENPGGTMTTVFTDTTGTSGTCSDSSLVGVGSLIRVDSERMIVTGRTMASTGQTITPSLTTQGSNNVFAVSSGAAFDIGETIMVDGEKMSIQEIAGNTLTVQRPWDGSTLAAHTGGTTIYAPRQLTLARGQLGTTAATHSANTPINVHAVPTLIRDLCIAEAMNKLWQERRSYAQATRRSESSVAEPRDVSTGLDDLRKQVIARYARLRTRVPARLV